MSGAKEIFGGKARGFVAALGVVCAVLPGVLEAQTSGGRPVQFLWAGRKAPIASPKPTAIADTSTYLATDTTRNSWLVAYVPSSPNGTAMVVIPGGGFDNLSPWGSEGVPAANNLNGVGVTAFILHYRIKPYAYPHSMWDVQRAVRWVRANAATYGIDPNRVGVLGFSAGGFVASTVATHFDAGLIDSNAANGPHWYPGPKDSVDRFSSRPNFQALVYPMTTMVQYVPGTTSTAYAYPAGRTNYIGTSPTQALVDYTSNEKQVSPQTPPAFLNWGTSDNVVNALNSTAYRDSLISKGVAVKTVVVAGGTHGSNTVKLDSLRVWMNLNGYMSPTSIRGNPARLHAPTHAYRLEAAPDALGRTGRLRNAAGTTLNIPLKGKDSEP